MAKSKEKKEQKLQPPQQQEAPGVESEMTPKPKQMMPSIGVVASYKIK